MLVDNRKIVHRVLLQTLWLNLFVMGLKAVVGWSTGSLSLLADALHSVTDSANNVLGLVINRFSSPIPDREHPYGHLKFEGVGALGIAAFLGIACFEILQGAIIKAIDGWQHGIKPITIESTELWLLLIVLGINIFVAFYERGVGLKIGSPILIADAKHTMSDIWVTIMVLAGLIAVWQSNILNYPILQWVDVILAFPVCAMVFYSGWQVVKDNLPWLVDQIAIPPEDIKAIAISIPGVIDCHAIASRGILGKQVFIEMHLVVNPTDLYLAHQISDQVEARLKEQFNPVRVMIHLEPIASSCDLIGS